MVPDLTDQNCSVAIQRPITTAKGQSGSGGRIEALEFLNSRPWRFPWIGWTEKDWYWDERDEKCKLKRLIGRRWERQPLVGLSAPNNAYLRNIHLCGADLEFAELQRAYLGFANKLTSEQIKSACSWDQAIYKGEWNWDKQTKTWVPKNKQAEQDNKKFIEELKKDKSSDPEETVDCSRWEE